MVQMETVDKSGGLRPPIVNISLPSTIDDAKAALMKSDSNGNNVYDHLTDIILRVLEQQSDDAYSKFEVLSSDVKASKLAPKEELSGLQHIEEETLDLKLANTRSNLFKSLELLEGEDTTILPNEGDFPDLLEESSMFEWGGVGLGREETVRLQLSMKRLLESNPLKNVRLFGKIYGRKRDYIIVESEFKEGEGAATKEEEPKENEVKHEDSESETENAEKETPAQTTNLEIESEQRSGTNRFSYWVQSAEEGWELLPDVTPAQVVASRKIRRFFTGDLTSSVDKFPHFPGNEANLLRAVIARITAATVISPRGYYNLEEEEVDALEVPQIQVNHEFEGLDPADLLRMNNWVHHYPFILNQGRCTFFRPSQANANEDEDDENEEEIEMGPRLLTDLSEDNQIGRHDAWTAKLSSTITSKFAHVILRSNRWPGAHAFAKDDRFANLYIGFGLKYSDKPFSPELPSSIQKEAKQPQECVDPSVQEEEEIEQRTKLESEEQEGSEDEEQDESEED
ncbi:radial spoke head protein 4 [Planoprotostelium fungivorum]|uniref:Radial spoke head protein 4 n=1 Tax=Planoprotostelium fungivorum TaxID=1890364 RepID=A0A2P6NI48_9EUKA|nr:radial spoke head protein 4 [Planoprotostelium fungivorum]